MSEPDIYWILDRWLERHPEVKGRERDIRITQGRWTPTNRFPSVSPPSGIWTGGPGPLTLVAGRTGGPQEGRGRRIRRIRHQPSAMPGVSLGPQRGVTAMGQQVLGRPNRVMRWLALGLLAGACGCARTT